MPQPVIVVTARRRPIEVSVLAISFLTGLLNLLRPSDALSALSQFVPFYPVIWSVGLMLGAAAGLVGATRELPLSLILERIGLSVLATMFVTYTAAIVTIFGARGWGSAIIVGGLALGVLGRIRQISRDLRSIEEAGPPP